MWAYAIKNKITAALLLFAVLALVLLTNFGERNSAEKIAAAVATIYEDRLVVEGYIFNYSGLLQQIKEIAGNPELDAPQRKSLISVPLKEIERINQLYAATQLTEKEKTNFEAFTGLYELLKSHVARGEFDQARLTSNTAGKVLQTLSAIQIEEAKAQMENVAKINSFSSLVSRFELVVLIIIAIVLQVLVLASRTLKSAKTPDNVHLN